MNEIQTMTNGQIIGLDITMAIDFIIYAILFLFVSYLVKEFLIKLKYGKQCQYILFYVMTYFIILLRILYIVITVLDFHTD